MKRALVLGFVGVVMIAAPGCGGSAEGAIKDSIAAMNDLSDALEKKESPEKIKAAADRFKTAMQKMKDIKVSKAEDERLKQKYEKELMDATFRLIAAAGSNPDGEKAVGDAMESIK